MNATSTTTRVLLADRPGFGRDALAGLLRSIAAVELVGVAGDGEQLGAALASLRPALLVVDDRLAGEVAAVHAGGPRMIVLGADDDPGFAARAARLGAEAWIEKDRAAQLLPALLTAPAGFSPPGRPRVPPAAPLGIGR